jgi:acyl dehydratase
MRVFASVAELVGAVGQVVGPGDALHVDQQRVDAFAEATGDHQWIHVDPQRAAAGPFGGTIAHGYLTLSLLPLLVQGLYRVEGLAMGINYGLNRVRFPAPLRVGSAVRATAELVSAEPVPRGYQLVSRVSVSAEGAERPCCVAETVTRLHPAG